MWGYWMDRACEEKARNISIQNGNKPSWLKKEATKYFWDKEVLFALQRIPSYGQFGLVKHTEHLWINMPVC